MAGNDDCGMRRGRDSAVVGRRKAEGGRRKAEGGRRKAEGGSAASCWLLILLLRTLSDEI
jgi:hypothetical protein